MPEISRFFGIVITMYYRDHGPPHFHARYGSQKVTVRLSDGLVTGRFPKRALAMTLEWWNLHRDELVENWEKAEESEPLNPIAPLE